MEWKLPEGLRPQKHSIASHAGSNALMEYSLTSLTGDYQPRQFMRNQTVSRAHHCHSDLDGIDFLLHYSTMRWMMINHENACSSFHAQPHIKAILEENSIPE
jgi:hypothetical protein